MTIAHKTRLSALAVALLVAAATLLVPPATASAGAGEFTIEGTAHLSDGIGSNAGAEGCLGGVASGAHGTDAAVASEAYAAFTYRNPDTVTGTASGNLKVMTTGGWVEVGFDWDRIGANAVITFDKSKSGHGGAGVATFAPVDVVVHECNTKSESDGKPWNHNDTANDEHATVVGTGVIHHNP